VLQVSPAISQSPGREEDGQGSGANVGGKRAATRSAMRKIECEAIVTN
jgi:hypothetical protein